MDIFARMRTRAPTTDATKLPAARPAKSRSGLPLLHSNWISAAAAAVAAAEVVDHVSPFSRACAAPTHVSLMFGRPRFCHRTSNPGLQDPEIVMIEGCDDVVCS